MNAQYWAQIPYEGLDKLDDMAIKANAPWRQVMGMAFDIGISAAPRLGGLRACLAELGSKPRFKKPSEETRAAKIPRSQARRLETMIKTERIEWRDAIYVVLMLGLGIMECEGGYGAIIERIEAVKIGGLRAKLGAY